MKIEGFSIAKNWCLKKGNFKAIFLELIEFIFLSTDLYCHVLKSLPSKLKWELLQLHLDFILYNLDFFVKKIVFL